MNLELVKTDKSCVEERVHYHLKCALDAVDEGNGRLALAARLQEVIDSLSRDGLDEAGDPGTALGPYQTMGR